MCEKKGSVVRVAVVIVCDGEGRKSMDTGMDHIPEPARPTPVALDCDIGVMGDSTTGVFAALAAARRGASVAIIESLGYLGGTATASLVCVWHSDMDAEFRRHIAAGLPRELIHPLDQRGPVITHETSPHWKWAFNPAEMACELDAMVVDAGVRLCSMRGSWPRSSRMADGPTDALRQSLSDGGAVVIWR